MNPEDDVDEAPETPRTHRSRLPLTTSEDFEALRPEWEALHAGTPGATFCQHPAFIQSWLDASGGEAATVFLSVRDGETLVGVVPMLLEGGRAMLPGDGDPDLADDCPILAAGGAAAAVARGLMEWLAEDMTPEATLRGIAEGSPLHDAITGLAERFGWDVISGPGATPPPASGGPHRAAVRLHLRQVHTIPGPGLRQ